MKKDLKKRIENVSGYTDQREVKDLKERLLIMNRLDKKNESIFKLAREKGIIL